MKRGIGLRVSLCALTALFVSAVSSGAENKIKKLPRVELILSGEKEIGQNYPMCLQLEKILNLSENAKTFNLVGDARVDLVFPKAAKLFKLVKWQPISIDEARTFFPQGELDKILASDKEKAVNLDKDWQPDSKFAFEKTTADYDAHSPPETFIRYRYLPKSQGVCLTPRDADGGAYGYHINGSWIKGAWSELPSKKPDTLKGTRFDHGLGGNGCRFFTYAGRVYIFERSFGGEPYVNRIDSFELENNPGDTYITPRALCNFKVKK